MQCKTDGCGQQCNRCRTAKVHCNYSEPGKPGRPPAKAGNVMIRSSAADKEPTGGVISPSNHTVAGADTWSQDTLPEYGTPKGSEYFTEEQMAPWSQHGFVNGFSDTACLQPDTDSLGPLPWFLNITEAEVCPSSTPSDNQPIHQGIPGEMGVAANPKPHSPNFKANVIRSVDQDYMQHLAHFQVTIARMMDCEVHLGPARLEQEAAHVLESSSKFLELIQVLASVAEPQNSSHLPNISWFPYDCPQRHRCRGSQESSPFNTAVFLQLTSISMRLIEMHHWLYSSIYRCLQQDPDTMKQDTAGNGDKSPAQPLLFSIAGVRLTPSPHFRLQMLLHTAVHYLGSFQKTLNELEALRFGAASEGSRGLPLPTRMLISEDQKGRMAKIRSVLAKLKEDFGIYTIL
ncbi:hypothetical protein DL770_003191 [Monosporascus sp. CRB-9-2]|nr:hypothetical protein DL770_003191 [Monosporascus sp. CRB-9-2]